MSSWAERNKEYIREYQKQYRAKNKIKRAESKKKWRENNKDRQRANLRRRHIFRMANDPLYKLERNLRKRLAIAVKRGYKSGSAIKNLGCTVNELKSYLQSKFLPGMTWENYGRYGWHIDHIVPLNRFDLTKEEELNKACNYTNLQPMWWRDNLRKAK